MGHYAGQNAWSRVAHRGFYSCVCPKSIAQQVSAEDVELLAWFPNLDRKTESHIKKKWKSSRIYGKSEWFPLECYDAIYEELLSQDHNCLEMCDFEKAKSVRRRL